MGRYGLLIGLLALAACGPDGDLVSSGAAHSCRLQQATKKLAENPEDATLAAEVKEATELLQAVIDTADEGKRSELGKAIAAEVAKGCD
jgi:hypothetical protein